MSTVLSAPWWASGLTFVSLGCLVAALVDVCRSLLQRTRLDADRLERLGRGSVEERRHG